MASTKPVVNNADIPTEEKVNVEAEAHKQNDQLNLETIRQQEDFGIIKTVLPSKVGEYDSEEEDEYQLETAKAEGPVIQGSVHFANIPGNQFQPSFDKV